jgi:hypothetical protein
LKKPEKPAWRCTEKPGRAGLEETGEACLEMYRKAWQSWSNLFCDIDQVYEVERRAAHNVAVKPAEF